MAATRPLLPPWHFSFLKEALLLPARNPALFGPIMALIVAEKVFHVSLAMLPLHEAQDVIIVGAVNLLTFVSVGAVIGAITTFAAFTAYGVDSEGETPAFLQDIRRLFDGGGGLTAGPVATAVHCQIVAVACQLGVAALLFLVDLVVRYTRTLLLLDLLVVLLLVTVLAQLYLRVVVSVAVVVSASEPGCHRAAALRQAWVTTAKNAHQAVILLIVNAVLGAAISPWRTTASGEHLVDLVNLLVSGVARVFFVCAITAYYNECRHRVPGRAQDLQLIQTGKEWLNSLLIQCRNKLQEILHGRFSTRHMLATLLARLQCLCVWMLAFFSTHPWVDGIAVVCASRLIAEGPPSILYRNELVSYRNFLRWKYHIYPKGCVDSWEQKNIQMSLASL